MITLQSIKSPDLRAKIKYSLKFQSLPKVEQESLLYMIGALPRSLQEKSLSKFFDIENKKEESARLNKQEALKHFMEKIKIAQMQIEKIAAKDKQISIEKIDQEKSNDLLKSLE